MAIKHRFTLFCDYFSRDHLGKSLFAGTFTNVQFQTFPSALLSGFVAVGFTAEGGDEISLYISAPTGQKKRLGKGPVIVAPSVHDNEYQIVEHILVTPLHGYVFDSEGIHHLELREGKRLVHRLPFGVYVAPMAANAEVENAD